MAEKTQGQGSGEKPSVAALTENIENQSIKDQPEGIREKSSQKLSKKSQQGKAKPAKQSQKGGESTGPKQQGKKKIEGAALIGIDVAKDADFSDWYQQVLTKGEFLDYYDVSGCVSICEQNSVSSAESTPSSVYSKTGFLFRLGRDTNLV